MKILRTLSALLLVADMAPACSTAPDDAPLVGVTLLNKQDVFYQELEAGMWAEAERQGMRLLVQSAEKDLADALRSLPAEHDATYDLLSQDALDGLIQLRLLDYGFVGQKGEDPRVALRITAYATTHFIRQERVVRTYTRDWVYEGKRRKLSTWMADDGRLFREELDKAVEELGEQVINDMFLSESAPAKRDKGVSSPP